MKKLYKNVHYQIACLLNQFNKGNCVYFHSGRVQIKTLIQDRSLGKILVLQIKGLNSSTDRALEPSLKQRHLLLASNTICFGKAKLFYSTMLSIYNSQEHEIFHFLPVFKIIIVLQQSQTAGLYSLLNAMTFPRQYFPSQMVLPLLCRYEFIPITLKNSSEVSNVWSCKNLWQQNISQALQQNLTPSRIYTEENVSCILELKFKSRNTYNPHLL